MRVGIVGYGVAGRIFHGRLLAGTAGAQVVAVVTRNAERRMHVALDHPGAVCCNSTAEMLAAGELDLAVVACPPAGHVEAARACIDARVPTVVEKPLALDAPQARALVDHAGRSGVPLTVFQNRRWDSDQMSLRSLIAAGDLGSVLRFESRFERWRPSITPGRWREVSSPEEGGGVLLDLGSHLVDQALILFGPVQSVYAEVQQRRGTAADDDVFVALQHDNGVYSHLRCADLVAAPGPRLRVLGTAGAFVVDDLDQQEFALRQGRSADDAAPSDGRLHRGDEVRKVAEPGAWSRFYPEVFDALGTGRPLPVDPKDSVRTLEVLDAARRAAAERAVVSV